MTTTLLLPAGGNGKDDISSDLAHGFAFGREVRKNRVLEGAILVCPPNVSGHETPELFPRSTVAWFPSSIVDGSRLQNSGQGDKTVFS